MATFFLLLLNVIDPDLAAARGAVILFIWLLVGGLLILYSRAFRRVAKWALALGLISVVTVRAAMLGGIQAPVAAFYVIFTMMTGVLLGIRSGVVAAVISLACGALLAWLQFAGQLPPERPSSSTVVLVYLGMYMALALLLQHLIATTLHRALDRATAELKKRESAELRLRLALEVGKVGVWEQEVADRSFHIDPFLFELHGLPVSDTGRLDFAEWKARVAPENLGELEAKLRDLATDVGQKRSEWRIVRPDGTTRHVMSIARSLPDDSGVPERIIGVSIDITEHHDLLFELQERIKELTLLHAAKRLLQRVPSARQHGFVLQEFVNLVPSGFQFPESCAARVVWDDMDVSTAGWNSAPWELSLSFSAADKSGYVSVVYTEQRWDTGDEPFLKEERECLEHLAEMLVSYLERWQYQENLEMLVASRTEELAAAKEAAEVANQTKGAFLASVTHELRTPINVILGYTQLLQEGAGTDDVLAKRLEAIRTSSVHLLQFVNDVLDMSKIEAGRIDLAQEPLDLRVLLDQVHSIFLEQAVAKRIGFYIDTTELPGFRIRGDEGKVRQILVNLVGNALKFTGTGQVGVRARAHQTGLLTCLVTLDVIDTGPGISEHDLITLFTPFSQGSAGIRAGGTGLGLAISHSLAGLLGGKLSVRTSAGSGSTFTLELPAVIDGERSSPDGASPGIAGTSDPHTLPPSDTDVLSETAATLPSDLVEELIEAARSARYGRLQLLVARLESHSPHMAACIRTLAENFRYADIVRTLAGKVPHD